MSSTDIAEFKPIAAFIALVSLCALAYGLWDLFRGASFPVGVVALIFAAANAFNIWAAFNSSEPSGVRPLNKASHSLKRP